MQPCLPIFRTSLFHWILDALQRQTTFPCKHFNSSEECQGGGSDVAFAQQICTPIQSFAALLCREGIPVPMAAFARTAAHTSFSGGEFSGRTAKDGRIFGRFTGAAARGATTRQVAAMSFLSKLGIPGFESKSTTEVSLRCMSSVFLHWNLPDNACPVIAYFVGSKVEKC